MKAILDALDAIAKPIGTLLDILKVRTPFGMRLTILAKGEQVTPQFNVSLVNRTKDLPLFVHSLRVHYGNKFYNHAFVLHPSSTVTIAPKDSKTFELLYANKQSEIRRTTLHKSQPNMLSGEFPTFSSPADLFKAIANDDKNHSWIEIDFNEFKCRRFGRGKIKKHFSQIISIGKSRFQQSAEIRR